MFTYSHANTPLGQSERAYYLSYFIMSYSCTWEGLLSAQEARDARGVYALCLFTLLLATSRVQLFKQ